MDAGLTLGLQGGASAGILGQTRTPGLEAKGSGLGGWQGADGGGREQSPGAT